MSYVKTMSTRSISSGLSSNPLGLSGTGHRDVIFIYQAGVRAQADCRYYHCYRLTIVEPH